MQNLTLFQLKSYFDRHNLYCYSDRYAFGIIVCSLSLVTIGLIWIGITCGLLGFKKGHTPSERSSLSNCGGIFLLMWVIMCTWDAYVLWCWVVLWIIQSGWCDIPVWVLPPFIVCHLLLLWSKHFKDLSSNAGTKLWSVCSGIISRKHFKC